MARTMKLHELGGMAWAFIVLTAVFGSVVGMVAAITVAYLAWESIKYLCGHPSAVAVLALGVLAIAAWRYA